MHGREFLTLCRPVYFYRNTQIIIRSLFFLLLHFFICLCSPLKCNQSIVGDRTPRNSFRRYYRNNVIILEARSNPIGIIMHDNNSRLTVSTVCMTYPVLILGLSSYGGGGGGREAGREAHSIAPHP